METFFLPNSVKHGCNSYCNLSFVTSPCSLWTQGMLLAEGVGHLLGIIPAVDPELEHQEPSGCRVNLDGNHLRRPHSFAFWRMGQGVLR